MLRNPVRVAVTLTAVASVSLLAVPSSQAVDQVTGPVCRTDPIKTAAGAVLPKVTLRTCLEIDGDMRRGVIHVDNASSSQVVTAQVKGGLMAPQYEIDQCVMHVLPGASAACMSEWAVDSQPTDALVGEVGAVTTSLALDRTTGATTSYPGVTTLLTVTGP
ncbi:hypothetical protein [Streptomyces sp. NPDC002516]